MVSGWAVAAILIAVFVYIELAVGFGYYMLRKTTKNEEQTKEERKQIRRYSIIAGAAFPITFAILMAGKAAERG